MLTLDRGPHLGGALPPTQRQLDALRAYVAHGTHVRAAAAMGISERTFKGHLSALRQRLGVHNTAQAVYVLWLGYRDHLKECPSRTHEDCLAAVPSLMGSGHIL